MSNKPRRETRRSQILRVFTENGSTFDGMSQSVIMEEIMLNFIIDEDRAARCGNICLICRCEWTLLQMMTTRELTRFLMLITSGRA